MMSICIIWKGSWKDLKTNGLKCKLSKCEFMKPSMKYLSFIVDGEGLHMTEDATRAVREAPRPESKLEMQSLMGLVNHYRQYAPNLSSIMSPLTELLQKNKRWEWSSECENAFSQVKRHLTTKAVVLVHYDLQKPVTLAVDASLRGLGAVLSHIINAEERPIAYASRSLTAAERNYSQLKWEGLAIIFGLRKFHQHIYGRRFTLIMGNKPLSHILGPKKGIPVLAASRLQ